MRDYFCLSLSVLPIILALSFFWIFRYYRFVIKKQKKIINYIISKKRKAETESSAKSRFLANISHELRTPLHSIIGFSEIILSESYGKIRNERYKEYVGDIKHSGDHLLSLINDILDFSKASSHKLKVDKVSIDLARLAKSCLRVIGPRVRDKGLDAVSDISGGLTVKADPKRLKQAILNVLSNSIKFTEPGGKIILSLFEDKERNLISLSVEDTGIGIKKEDIGKALSPFGQIDGKLNRKYEGTGIGLPLTKKLIELMGGLFSIESFFGSGTKVTFSFSSSEEDVSGR